MLSFRSILEAHGPLLWIDSASTQTQVGVLRATGASVWASSAEEAGIAIFSGTEKVLRETELELSSIGAFVFCEGPGSVLGIRLAAAAVRTWCVIHTKPVFAYASLSLLAEAIARSEKLGDFSAIADARRDSWHQVKVDTEGRVSPLRRVSTAALQGPLITPDLFRHWTPPPPNLRRVGYNLTELLSYASEAPLLHATNDPDAFLHEEPSYQTWSPQIHRAPS